MTEWLKALFVSIFGTNSELATFFISMIPIIELRGAIPFGTASALWGENALSLPMSLLFSILGSSLVCVILTFLFMPIFKWLSKTKIFKKLAKFIENKLSKHSKEMDEKTQKEHNEKRILRIKLISIFIFVAIPLPLTGVWTGTCLALFVGLNKKQTMLSVISGNVVAGLLMTLVTLVFNDNTLVVLYAFMILAVIFILYEVIKTLIKKARNKKQNAFAVANANENTQAENIEEINNSEAEKQEETEISTKNVSRETEEDN